jgi:hypothetical protein
LANGVHDASWYNGKVYLYYGPVPALTYFIPAIFLGLNTTDKAAVIFFIFSALIVQSLLIMRLLRFNDDKNLYFFLICIFVLAFASPSYFLLQRPMVYEVAMASSNFFISLALLFLLNRLLFNKHNYYFILSSFCFILSVGCRLTTLFPSIILIFISIFFIRKEKSFKINCIYLLTPFMIGICFLLIYNYVRFDSFTEFGISYIISEFHPLDVVAGFPKGSKLNSFINLFMYYLFNYVYINEIYVLVPYFNKIEHVICNEDGVWGLISCFPVKWSLISFPFIFKRWLITGQNRLLFLNLGLIISAFIILFLLCLIPLIAYRYLLNINLFLTIPALLIWGYYMNQLWFQHSNSQIIYKPLANNIKLIFLICSIVSIMMGISTVIIGQQPNVYLEK